MAEEGLKEVETYVSCLQNTVAQFISNMPIMDLCLAAEQRPGSRVSRRWWDQDRVDVEGMRTEDRKAVHTDGVGGYGRDGDRYGQLIRWDYTVANVILWTEPNYPFAYDLGLELHHPIMSMLGGHGGRLEREIER